jgi:protein-tyrosine phosphatase
MVFGARRPGYDSGSVSEEQVEQWLSFVMEEGMRRVVCLLDYSQLAYYRALSGGLIVRYNESFGSENVLSAPIQDYELCTAKNLDLIMEFLDESQTRNLRTVVHCSGGSGRTGHVLAAWLVHSRNLAPIAAIEAIKATGRDAEEAVKAGNATADELNALLAAVAKQDFT